MLGAAAEGCLSGCSCWLCADCCMINFSACNHGHADVLLSLARSHACRQLRTFSKTCFSSKTVSCHTACGRGRHASYGSMPGEPLCRLTHLAFNIFTSVTCPLVEKWSFKRCSGRYFGMFLMHSREVGGSSGKPGCAGGGSCAGVASCCAGPAWCCRGWFTLGGFGYCIRAGSDALGA